MLHTLTVAPSLDYYAELPSLETGTVCRASGISFRAGGKGLNVSRMLNILGVNNRAICCVAGFVGDELVREMENMGISHTCISLLDGCSRINLKLRETNSLSETEINAPASELDKQAIETLVGLISAIPEDDSIILSGSVAGTQPELYAELMRKTECRCFLDCTGRSLELALREKPYLIKPNLPELEMLCGEKLSADDHTSILRCADRLRSAGAQRVLVSLAGSGALLLTATQALYALVPQRAAVNSTGAGDSLLAGYAAATAMGMSDADALRHACAGGSAKALASDFPTLAEIKTLLNEIIISEPKG